MNIYICKYVKLSKDGLININFDIVSNIILIYALILII